ncbi:ribosomal protein S18-alanine N-acetyltransferase [Thalassotalea atypica]|uniref:ribosomal protein S18-alanine N-acetyltransferase n=1 Tax=Thalassotalea atypica TaxID=2054316 RepID=UPI0025748105|nr:ribosomal protein S18-alanine N-acetyltransferase [Thalassotalea atypica]
MTLSFTSISTNDVEQLMPIENAAHSHPWSVNTFSSCIGGRYFGEVARINNDEIAGFYIGEHVAGEATLMDICVPPALQGNGYGKTLLLKFIAQSKELNAHKLWLEVRSSNISAQMLYINQGFIETGRRTGYYPKAVGYEDAIVMCKTL